jgi:GNAT superfamily N-acetyltransferase
VAVKQARKEDLEKFVSIVSAKKYREFQRRINNGRICFMVLDGDKAIGYSWISLDDEYIPDGGVDVVLGEKEAFLFDDYILPQYRGKGLQSALIPPRLAYLREHGYLVGLSYIHDVNTVAMKAPVTAGFMPKRTVSVFMISGMKIRRLREFSGNLPVTK